MKDKQNIRQERQEHIKKKTRVDMKDNKGKARQKRQ